MANVSTTYYTFLEQGRPVRPSDRVLDALAAALRMSPAEHSYLRTLAGGGEPVTTSTAPVEQVAPGISDLLRRLEPGPSLLKGRSWDVLAANDSARELFGDWLGEVPEPASTPPNLVRWMFTSAAARHIYLEWEPEARAMLGRFRLAAARHPGDPAFEALISSLLEDSEEVRNWWPRQDVVDIGSGSKKLRHPRFGPTDYTHVVLQVADRPDQTVVAYTSAG